jgi:protein-S-isoprenylcysteine O-methyltransferase Ste14
MTNELIFRLLTVALLLTAFSISIYFRHKAEREGGQLDKTQGQGLLVVLRLLGLVVMIPLLLYIINPAWVAWARFWPPDWMRWLAAFCALSMLPAIYWLFRTIGNNISPTQATRRNHQLITDGPYRWIRHPLYTFGAVFYLAITLLTGLWWLGIGLALVFVILLWRTPQEEANLMARFGDEYRAYMQRTGRYWPKLRPGK